MMQATKPEIARQRPMSVGCNQTMNNGDTTEMQRSYRKCETTGLDGGVAEKDEEYVKGRVRETKASARQADGANDRNGNELLQGEWRRSQLLV
jgi:hypothetical protein